MYTVRPTGVVGAEVVAGTVAVVVVDVVVVGTVVGAVVASAVVTSTVVAVATGASVEVASALVEPSVCAGVVAVVAAAMSDTSGHSTQPPSKTAHNMTQRHRAAARCRGFFKKCIKSPSYLV